MTAPRGPGIIAGHRRVRIIRQHAQVVVQCHFRGPSTAAAAALTCGQISAPLSRALADLKASDAHYQEAWVSGGYQADLQALIDATASPGSGTSLSSDAATFNS